MALVGTLFLFTLVMIAVGGPLFLPYSYDHADLSNIFGSPNLGHPLGTDALGRDVLGRLVYGARISLSVGITSTLLVLAIGVPIGLLAGYFGGTFDLFIMRLVDVLYGIPYLLLILLLQTFFVTALPTMHRGPLAWLGVLNRETNGVAAITTALVLVGWLDVTRIVRGQVLAMSRHEFVQAARSLGASDWRIMEGHLLPNVLALVIVTATLSIPNFIITEAGLSFLGLGIQPPMPSWGIMIAEGIDSIQAHPRLVIVPALALMSTLLSLNFVGDGLRDALDPVMMR